MNAAYSQLEIGRRIKITWQRSNDTAVPDAESNWNFCRKRKTSVLKVEEPKAAKTNTQTFLKSLLS